MVKQEAEMAEGNVYEVGYLVLPSIPEEKLSVVVESIKKAIQKAGGVEIDGEEPFRYPLAYTMYKTVGASRYVASEAYIGWIKFEAQPSHIAKIKADIEKMNEILRFLLIKAPRKTDFTFAKAKAKTMESAPLPVEGGEEPAEEVPQEGNNEPKEAVVAPTPNEE